MHVMNVGRRHASQPAAQVAAGKGVSFSEGLLFDSQTITSVSFSGMFPSIHADLTFDNSSVGTWSMVERRCPPLFIYTLFVPKANGFVT